MIPSEGDHMRAAALLVITLLGLIGCGEEPNAAKSSGESILGWIHGRGTRPKSTSLAFSQTAVRNPSEHRQRPGWVAALSKASAHLPSACGSGGEGGRL